MKENQNKQEQKKIIDNIYYQKNKEKKKEQRKIRYQEQKKAMTERIRKYSQAENYKVLLTLKEYTLLNAEKHKKWLDFDWTLKDLAETGTHNISEVMRLCELGEILIKDYWQTAKREEFKGKHWQSLPSKKKERLIKLWAKEKVREEMAINEGLEAINERAKEQEKEVEMDKFHLERGKQKCQCWQCAVNKPQVEENSEEQCAECGKWVKKLDEENEVCKNCLNSYE